MSAPTTVPPHLASVSRRQLALPRALGLLLPIAFAGCAASPATRTGALTVEEALLHAPRAHIESPLDLDSTIRHALDVDPELRAARTRAMAEAADTPGADVRFGAEKLGIASGSRLYLSIDPFAWAGLGPRGARLDAVAARAALRWSEVREIELQIERSIATAFAKGRVLSAWAVPEVDLDAGPLLAAGMASTEAVNAVEAARLLADAERQSIETGLASVRATVATHLAWIDDGSSPTLPIAFPARAIQTASSDPADLNDERAWLGRPDLSRALAELVVADAEVRIAATQRYPELRLGPDLAVGAGGLGGLILLRLPVFSSGPLRAASLRREAARVDLERTLVNARAEIATATATRAEAIARQRSTMSRRRAAKQSLDVALTTMTFAPETLLSAARSVHESLEADRAAREAELLRASSEIALFYARGGERQGAGRS